MTSSDGETWSVQTSGTTNKLNTACGNNPHFVVVGDSGTILYSNGGTTWQRIIVDTTENIASVCYDGSNYIALIENSDKVLTSSDGVNWTAPNSIRSGKILNHVFNYTSYYGNDIDAKNILTSDTVNNFVFYNSEYILPSLAGCGNY